MTRAVRTGGYLHRTKLCRQPLDGDLQALLREHHEG
jgi:hypothetical protein